MKKNNQAKSHFSYKNDDVELVEIGQHLRDTTDFVVKREHYIFFDKMSGKYMGYDSTVPNNCKYKVRNPDLILCDKEGNIRKIIEIDGSVHDKKFFDTEQRNEEYFMANLPLVVVSKLDIKTNIFDLVDDKIMESICKR